MNERREFAGLVEKALLGFSLSPLKSEHQMIPEGFDGRLENNVTARAPKSTALKGKSLTINLLPLFEEAKSFQEALTKGFADAGIELKFEYSWSFKPDGSKADVLLAQFAGNQRDAMGSWQFMFSPGEGPLAGFRPEVEPIFKRIMAAETQEARAAALKDLHRQTLAEPLAVPMFVEADTIVYSDRIDASELNPFDMRLRFNAIRWK